MAKNYANIYASTNDSIGLEQAWYAKLESTKGTLIGPTNSDFFHALGGGSIEFTQPFESSPHRSGRHHTDIIKKKKETSWKFSTYFNINVEEASAISSEIDTPIRLLHKSLLGSEDTSAGAVYTAGTPDLTFSLHEVGDKWSKQSPGCFVQDCNMNFPGDGEATCEWSGMAAVSYMVGIGKSTTNNNANTVTLQTGEGKRFPVGSLVMIIKNNGTTRSTDTASGSYRKVTSVSGDVVTVNGSALTDANGSSSPVYLVYAEPAAPSAINNPQTGLVGSISVTGLTMPCFRSATVSMKNDHEVVNYCFGTDQLAAPYFVPAARFTAELTLEFNFNDEALEFFNRVQNDFEAQEIEIILGNSAGRHLKIEIPKVIFSVPPVSVPESGSIAVSFTGNCYQSALDAADEITISYL